MLYDYYAIDINGFEIAREGVDRETMMVHHSNLVVMGYRVYVREHLADTGFLEAHRFFAKGE